MLRLGLVGGAHIAGSSSPRIHTAFLQAAGLDGSYTLLATEPAGLADVLGAVRSGYRGVNVTMPHKAAAAAACDRLEGDAALLGVVNTLTVEPGGLSGDNTDAGGLEQALAAWAAWPQPPPRRAVVLGAGGAASAALLALHRLGVGELLLAARRPEAVAALQERLAGALELTPLAWDAAAAAEPTVLVNATPAGAAELPVRLDGLPEHCRVVDIRSRPRPTDLVSAAQRSGRAACDGLEMLLRQAALSFERWSGRPASLEAARTALAA